MKYLLTAAIGLFLLSGCENKPVHGKFTVTGDIRNVPDQKVYLDQLYFSDKDPDVLDTAAIKDGHFVLSGIAPDEGIFRLRLEKNESWFLFINDTSDIHFYANPDSSALNSYTFSTPVNVQLKNFMLSLGEKTNIQRSLSSSLDSLEDKTVADTTAHTDSLVKAARQQYAAAKNDLKHYMLQYIDTASDPVLVLYALGYNSNFDPEELEHPVHDLKKRFPKNETIATTIADFDKILAQYKATPHIGSTAPDISLPDTSGKIVSLHSLRGQYVLVDFWASWCGPCRAENPNVVRVYNLYKDKNFTILGVSLDKEKKDWEEAINTYKLSWQHISDLQGWNGTTVATYGVQAIPYNVLVDPQGKIIGISLRGRELRDKLAEVLK